MFLGDWGAEEQEVQSLNIVDFIWCPSSSSWKHRLNRVTVLRLLFRSETQHEPDLSHLKVHHYYQSKPSHNEDIDYERLCLRRDWRHQNSIEAKVQREEQCIRYIYWDHLDYFMVALIAGAKSVIPNHRSENWAVRPKTRDNNRAQGSDEWPYSWLCELWGFTFKLPTFIKKIRGGGWTWAVDRKQVWTVKSSQFPQLNNHPKQSTSSQEGLSIRKKKSERRCFVKVMNPASLTIRNTCWRRTEFQPQIPPECDNI